MAQSQTGATADWRPDSSPDVSANASTDDSISPILMKPAGSSIRPEIQSLLRRRLKLLCLLYAGANTIIQLPAWWALLRNPALFLGGSLPEQVSHAMCAISCVLTVVLWSRMSLDMIALRSMEVFMVFGAFGSFALGIYYMLTFSMAEAARQHESWRQYWLLPWVSSQWALWMAAYGVFVPNTWRRCLAVVGALCLMPIAAVGLASMSLDATTAIKDALWRDLNYAGATLAAGAFVAVYGTHKIASLNEEVRAARQLGQYTLKRRLGAGGMGEVYLAEHRLLKRPCAVKLIRPERAGDTAMLQRFEREVQAMTRLTHWNVVEVFDYGRTDDGTFYYVMEYLSGLTLDHLVKKNGPLPPARAVHLMRQVCAALAEAHAKGLIHRDLKPGNIIVGERGGVHDVAKLLDFGLVQGPDLGGSAEKLTLHGMIIGTPAYMSPEQAQGHELVPASDLYSLGALGYFLLTGEPPFVRPSVVQTITAHITDAPTPPTQFRPEIPADLESIIMRCLEKNLAARFPDAAGLEKALAATACADAWSQADAREAGVS